MTSEPLSRRDLAELLELSHRCVAAGSEADLQAVLASVQAMTSFERVVLCALADDPADGLAGAVNHSFGEGWGRVYAAQRFDRIDPVLRHARRARGPFRWEDALAAGGPPPPGSAQFLEAARDVGLVHGVAAPCRPRASSAATLLSLASRREPDADRALAVAAALGPHLHEAYDRLRRRDAAARPGPRPVTLTAREREVLAWTQDGKTFWEIGQIVGISPRTVKYHFARLRQKLDAVSASHAVAKAMRLGLLD